MKINKRSAYFLLLLLCQIIAKGQETPRKSMFSSVNEYHPGIKFTMDASLTSSAFNAIMIHNYFWANSFSKKALSEYKSSTKKQNNTFLNGRATLSYRPVSQGKNREYILSYHNRIYYSAGKDFTQLLLFGNADFSGEKVITNQSLFLSYDKLSGGIKQKLAGKEQCKLYAYMGIGLVFNYQDISLKSAEIFTQSQGEYLDIVLEELKFNKNRRTPDALSFDLGIDIEYNIGKQDKIILQLQNISPVFLFDNMQYQVDTSFRFEGFALEGRQLLGNNINNYGDSILNKSLYTDSVRQHFTILPPEIALTYRHDINYKHGLEIDLNGTIIQYPMLSFEITHQFISAKQYIIKSSIGYGNYTGFIWSETLELTGSKGLHYLIKLQGLNAAVLPYKSTVYGAGLGIAKNF